MSYKNNEEERKAYQKAYRAKNKEKAANYQKNYQKSYNKTPAGIKTNKLKVWKHLGIKDDLSNIYDNIYILSIHCDVCKVEYKSSFDKCLDHDHDTGLFRQMLCRACNNNDSWKFPDRIKNREKTKEYNAKAKLNIATCECGCKVRRSDLAKHKRTKKHLKLIGLKLM